MSSRSRELRAKVLNPERTRRKKFKCCACSYGSYSARDYEILFKAKKIIFFLFPFSSSKVYCNACLYVACASKIQPGEDYVKVIVEDLEQSYILHIEQE